MFAGRHDDKKPGSVFHLPGFVKISDLALPAAVSVLSGSSQSFPSQSFALFSAPELARLFIALFQFEPFEKAVILNFFLQNPHRLFNVIIKNLNLNFLQTPRPLLSIKIIPDGY